MPTIQYSALRAHLPVHKLFTSCSWRGLVSRDSIVDGDWLPVTEWCQRYLPCCQPASVVSENLGMFLVRSVQTRNDFELIPTIEMETRNIVEGYFGREFSAVSSHCGFMATWSCKMLKKLILAFFRKTTPDNKIFKILFWKISSRHQTTCYVQISWRLADAKWVKSCVAYLTK